MIRLLLFALLATAAAAQTPRTLSFQGRLEDPVGTAATGPVSMTLALYDVATSGAPLHVETDTVALDDAGTFVTTLGDPPAAALEPRHLAQQLWVGIALDGGAELAPRTPLAPAPGALRAATAERLDHYAATFVVHNGVSSVDVGPVSAVLLDWSSRTSGTTVPVNLPDPAEHPGRQLLVANVAVNAGVPHSLSLVTPSGSIGALGPSAQVDFQDRTERFVLLSDGTDWLVVGGSGE